MFNYPFQLSIFFGGLGLKHLQHLVFKHAFWTYPFLFSAFHWHGFGHLSVCLARSSLQNSCSIRVWVYVCRSRANDQEMGICLQISFDLHSHWKAKRRRIDFVQIGLGNMCNDYDIKCADFSWSTTIGLPNGSRNAYFQPTRFPNGSQEWIVNPNGCYQRPLQEPKH